MPSNVKGHTVQIWQPSGNPWDREYVTVGSRFPKGRPWWRDGNFRVARTATHAGWMQVRRVGLTRKQAIKLAKEFHRAGFDARVIHYTNSGRTITDSFLKNA